jgi:hypothetical protein
MERGYSGCASRDLPINIARNWLMTLALLKALVRSAILCTLHEDAA